MPHWSPLVFAASAEYNLEPTLLAAVIAQESAGNPWAIRFEWGFYNKYVKGKVRDQLLGHVPSERLCSIQSEKFARAYSWGLCQIMGQTAREQGLKTDFISQLLDPEINIPLGAKILRYKIDRARGSVAGGLLLWNGGANKEYPEQVLQKQGDGTAGRLLTP